MNLFELDTNSLILKSYIERIIRYNFPKTRKTSKGWNFRCNICGDSISRKSSRQGWVLYRSGTYFYYCHVCGESMSATRWMKTYFNSDYKDYILELLKLNKDQKPSPKQDITEEIIEIPTIKKTEYVDLFALGFKPIESSDSPTFVKARTFCKLRNIPYEVWSKWFIALPDNSDIKYRNRLIIPFYENGNVFYFQGRTLGDNAAKYVNLDLSKEDNIILYNRYGVDYEKPIIVVEGPIDSLFCDNCLAGLGTNIGERTKEFLDRFNCYYLFDNDEPGRKKALEYLRLKKNVFLWKKFVHDYRLQKQDKWDLNEACLYLKKDKFSFEELSRYFSNNILNSMFI